ncbi:Protein of unknown function [Pyronema omphalodes CBS 100304]|uniref:Uncharacterized protein n=1 Tax=Pyronema omphalodes (strain CBS 100304) TaxID=1076935 RepID=U4L4Z0_PYROM|nr:Protein of unknown function [Pyronema omphalodes CBS 100304]
MSHPKLVLLHLFCPRQKLKFSAQSSDGYFHQTPFLGNDSRVDNREAKTKTFVA